MNKISEALKRPAGVEEWTYPLVRFNDYPIEEQLEYAREHADSILWMKESHPDAFAVFLDRYGQEFADEVLAIATR